jgi:hypothetical protein
VKFHLMNCRVTSNDLYEPSNHCMVFV